MTNRFFTTWLLLLWALIYTTTTTAQYGSVEGTVNVDYGQNCFLDATDVGWHNVVVEAEHNVTNNKYYGITDSIGNFSINVADSGNYTLSTQDFFNLVPCQATQSAFLGFQGDQDTAHFLLDPTHSCPVMNVGVSTPLLRLCDTALYHIKYSNDGPVEAINAYIDVELDSFLTIDTSLTTRPIDGFLGNNTYRFNLDTVDANKFNDFYIGVRVQCGGTVGRTHCVQAKIYPNSPCNTSTFVPKIETKGQCIGNGQLEFYIHNKGNADMQTARNAWIIEDQVVILGQPFTLDSSDTDTITITNPVPGAMYRIEAEQDSATPKIMGNQKAWAFVEGGCNTTSGINTGFATDYYTDDNSPYIAHSCQQNVASLVNANKIGYPEGYDNANYIECNLPIKYRVHFQNTTGSNISAVYIKDTLSEHLNLKTFKVTGFSHKQYYLDIEKDRSLSISVYGNFPSANVNEDKSHGFIEYTLEQNKDLPDGTVINNTAHVSLSNTNNYVASNPTLHTIGKNFIVSSVANVFVENVAVKAYPNPFQEKTTLAVLGVEYPQLELSLYNMAGQLVQQQKSTSNQFEVYRNNLPAGVYIYKITSKQQLINVGKVITQ